MKMVALHDAKAQLFRQIDEAAAGEEIVIAKSGKPVARLVGLARPAKRRPLGTMKGRIKIGPDFNAPLPRS